VKILRNEKKKKENSVILMNITEFENTNKRNSKVITIFFHRDCMAKHTTRLKMIKQQKKTIISFHLIQVNLNKNKLKR
jgi:hypothetical protein